VIFKPFEEDDFVPVHVISPAVDPLSFNRWPEVTYDKVAQWLIDVC